MSCGAGLMSGGQRTFYAAESEARNHLRRAGVAATSGWRFLAPPRLSHNDAMRRRQRSSGFGQQPTSLPEPIRVTGAFHGQSLILIASVPSHQPLNEFGGEPKLCGVNADTLGPERTGPVLGPELQLFHRDIVHVNERASASAAISEVVERQSTGPCVGAQSRSRPQLQQ